MQTPNANARQSVSTPSAKRGLLMLAYFFPPQNTSGAARPYRLYKYLPDFGYPVDVICSDEDAGAPLANRVYAPAPPPAFSVAGACALGARIVQRCTRRYGFRLPWAAAAVQCATPLIRENRISAVISTSPPLGCHLGALALKLRHKLRWIADFRDPLYPDPPLFGEKVRFYEPMAERAIFRHADVVLVNTAAAAEMWCNRYPWATPKIVTLYNGFDPAEPVAAEPLPQRSYRVLTHAGEIYGPRDPSRVVEALERLLGHGRLAAGQFRLSFVGPIEDHSPLNRCAAFSRLKENGVVECTGRRVPQEEARRALAGSDFLLLIDTSGKVQVPAKIFEYIRIGRPVLALTTAGSTAECILAESGIRYVSIYSTDTEEEVDRKLGRFLAFSTDPVAASARFCDQFDGISQARHLARLLDSLFGMHVDPTVFPNNSCLEAAPWL